MIDRESDSVHRKTIRALEKKAQNQDVQALFQLFKFYSVGKYVEKDPIKASQYWNDAISLFQRGSIRLGGLKLFNYRVFKEFDVEFAQGSLDKGGISVFVGVNGVGKTAVLEGIASCLSWILKGISSHGGKGEAIKDDDIHRGSQIDYSSIVSSFDISENFSTVIELSKSLPKSNTSRRNMVSEATFLSELYKECLSSLPRFNLPIIAYYSIDRAVEVSKKDINIFRDGNEIKSPTQLDGYKSALSGSADFSMFFGWYKWLTDLVNFEGRNTLQELGKIIKSDKNLQVVKDLLMESNKNIDLQELLGNLAGEKVSKLISDASGSASKSNYSRITQYVENAICSFMPDLSNIRVQYEPDIDLLVDKNGLTLSVLQLSQGEKSLFALVADIARRLVLLNPDLENPLNGSGIVLIDELDLHLHPSWQQKVVPNLRGTFPHIQFIATTHSPYITTTLDSKEIFILEDGNVYRSPPGTKGAELSRLSRSIFNVGQRPPLIDNTKKLEKYQQLVYDDKWDTDEAKSLAAELIDTYGNEEPLLAKLQDYIDSKEWERDIEKNK